MEFKTRKDKIIKISDLLVKIILSIVLLIMIFEFYIFFSGINGDYNFNIFGNSFNFEFIMNYLEIIQSIQLLVSTILIVMIRVISKIYIDKLDLDYLKNYLYSVDNNAVLYLDSSTEMVFKNLEDEYSYKVRSEGCIRHKNEYNLETPKYKCKLKKYYVQESKRYRIRNYSTRAFDGKYRTTYKFVTIDNIIEYVFELLDNNKYYPMLYQKLNRKFNDIAVTDNTVVIKLHLKDDMSIFDTIDKIEELYFEILKFMGEENTN